MSKIVFARFKDETSQDELVVKAPAIGIAWKDFLVGTALTIGGIIMFIGGGHVRGVNNGIKGFTSAINEKGLVIEEPSKTSDKEAE